MFLHFLKKTHAVKAAESEVVCLDVEKSNADVDDDPLERLTLSLQAVAEPY